VAQVSILRPGNHKLNPPTFSVIRSLNFSYDAVGRPTGMNELLPSGTNKLLTYTYDQAGRMLTSTDGSSVKTTYAYTNASEVSQLTSSLSDATDPSALASVSSGPFGPTSYSLGNGLTATYSYDTLGRMSGGTLAPTSGGTALYAFTSGWKGARLQSSKDSVLGQSSSYGYDGFNRLLSSSVTVGTGPSYAWSYDRYGNRWSQTATGGSGVNFSQSFSNTTNRLSTGGYTYDAAGNMTYDGNCHYTYDAEGNITTVYSCVTGTASTYVYNALNQRVRTSVGTATTEFVFNVNGQRVSEWNASTHAQLKGKYYLGGQPVAYYTTSSSGSAGTHFEHTDWLGTERLRTTYNSAASPKYAQEGSYTSLPWGDGQTPSTNGTDAAHYAQLDHDAETGTDHADFRQYSNAQGRFMSPDPYDGSYDASNPQSMNRYVYAMNNPLSNVDPSGRECVWDDGSYDEAGDEESGSPSRCRVLGGTWVDHSNFEGMPDWCGGPGCSDSFWRFLSGRSVFRFRLPEVWQAVGVDRGGSVAEAQC